MLLAQLRRKVPTEFEGMEDVLTSSVLGLFKYLPNELAIDLLAEVAAIPSSPGPLQLELWPRYPTPSGFRKPALAAQPDEEPADRGETEPDAQITTDKWWVLVEAKYRSPLDEAFDQLGREFAVGYQRAKAKDEGLRFRLLVITAHSLQPALRGVSLVAGVQHALRRASSGLGNAPAQMIAAVPDALRWTNWQRVYAILDRTCHHKSMPDNTRGLMEDVCQLLAMRGLRPYDARPLAKIASRFDSAGITAALWSRPVRYRYLVTASIAAGWGPLMSLELDLLDPPAWRLQTSVSNYDADEHLGHFELGLLRVPKWLPYQ